MRMSGWLSASVLARNFHVPTLIRAWQQRRFCERLTRSPHTRPPPPKPPHMFTRPCMCTSAARAGCIPPPTHHQRDWWVARAIYSKGSNRKQPVPVTDTLTAPTHSHHTHQLFPYLYTRPRMRRVHSTPCQRKREVISKVLSNISHKLTHSPPPHNLIWNQTVLTPTRPICWSLHVLGLPPSFPSPAPTAGPANDQ